jgi:hypothetical protein
MMRRIFRLRNLVIVAVAGVAIGLVAASRRQSAPAVPYPDPWITPVAPGGSGGEASEPAGTPSSNGVAGEVGEPAGS